MREDLLNKFLTIFADIMDLDDPDVSESTSAGDFEEWDSLSHVRLVVAIEREFGIKFTNAEIDSFKCVGDLLEAIARKTS